MYDAAFKLRLPTIADTFPHNRHCFIATILLKYFVTAGFFWMFVEGLYLLVSVRFSFRRDLISYTLCASIGWGIPLLLITVSSAIRAQTDHEGCWNEPSPLDYIFLGPVVAALFGLFVLCPLLGTSYVFTLVPPHHPQWLVLVFSYITTILTSTQGILIAVLFCFSNSEVIFCIKKSYSQYLERWHPRRCSSCYMKLFGSLSENSRETTC
ncbi:7tm 2 domain containing protein [Trichuris trichiura]|uniref:7tm 2 domain containing protein n=1 Tax=Trichuris trichiura TaxID=36087 RepID=A0A077Z9C7_TRITR|nr:7tm 2 domain containing protein [Trichuris trichiura]